MRKKLYVALLVRSVSSRFNYSLIFTAWLLINGMIVRCVATKKFPRMTPVSTPAHTLLIIFASHFYYIVFFLPVFDFKTCMKTDEFQIELCMLRNQTRYRNLCRCEGHIRHRRKQRNGNLMADMIFKEATRYIHCQYPDIYLFSFSDLLLLILFLPALGLTLLIDLGPATGTSPRTRGPCRAGAEARPRAVR